MESIKNAKTLYLIGLSVFILGCTIVLLSRFTAKKPFSAPPVQYSIDEEPVLPSEPGTIDSYVYTNEVASSWTKEQGEAWFTPPEGKQLEQLENSNDILVKRILESAP